MASIELKDLSRFIIMRPNRLSGLQSSQASPSAHLSGAISSLRAALTSPKSEARTHCLEGLYLLRDTPMRSMPDSYDTETPCPSDYADQTDEYMYMRRVDSDRPFSVLTGSVLHAYFAFIGLDNSFAFDAEDNALLQHGLLAFAELLDRCAGHETAIEDLMPASTEIEAWVGSINTEIPHDHVLDLWRQSHWMFYAIIQGLILAFDRFVHALERGDMALATTELKTATALMWASGASMKQTASFSHEEYRDTVRPTMALDSETSMVSVVNMSGTIAWDHQYLVNNLWRKRLSPNLAKVTTGFGETYTEFVHAYRDGLSKNHKYVCGRFGGEETGSLLVPNVIANTNLERIEGQRLKQLGAEH